MSAVPLPPTKPAASGVTSDSVTLTWTSGNTKPVQSYIIQYKCQKSVQYTYIYGVTTTQYTISSLKANNAYEFRIVAVNNAGQSLPSALLLVATSKGRLITFA